MLMVSFLITWARKYDSFAWWWWWGGSPCDEMAKMLDCTFVVSKFKLHHTVTFTFGLILLGKV